MQQITNKYERHVNDRGNIISSKKHIPHSWLKRLVWELQASGREAVIRYVDGCPVVFADQPKEWEDEDE
jgi:hypothetical protein